MRLLTISLALVADVYLPATGRKRTARAPEEREPSDNSPYSDHKDVAEVNVTAECPGRLMPEAAPCLSQMPELVVHASWSGLPAALVARPPADTVN